MAVPRAARRVPAGAARRIPAGSAASCLMRPANQRAGVSTAAANATATYGPKIPRSTIVGIAGLASTRSATSACNVRVASIFTTRSTS